jgi:hypothetical protein
MGVDGVFGSLTKSSGTIQSQSSNFKEDHPVHSTETLSGNCQEIPMQENKLDRSQSIEGYRSSDIDPSEKLHTDDHSTSSKKRS